MFSMISILEALLIVTALSIDAFVSGFAYGANKIKIPLSSVTVINIICSGILALSLLLGGLLHSCLPPQLTTSICFLLLLCLGVTKIFDSAIKTLIRRHRTFQKNIHFSAFHLGFILNIYANPEDADRDHSRVLSPLEATYLAIALSLDGLAVGFSAGITNTSPVLVIAFSLILTCVAIGLGCWLGNKFTQKLQFDFTWLSGVLLIFLAIMKLP